VHSFRSQFKVASRNRGLGSRTRVDAYPVAALCRWRYVSATLPSIVDRVEVWGKVGTALNFVLSKVGGLLFADMSTNLLPSLYSQVLEPAKHAGVLSLPVNGLY